MSHTPFSRLDALRHYPVTSHLKYTFREGRRGVAPELVLMNETVLREAGSQGRRVGSRDGVRGRQPGCNEADEP